MKKLMKNNFKLLFIAILLTAIMQLTAPILAAERVGQSGNSTISPERYFTEAYQSYKDKDFEKAIDLFKMAIVDNPDNFMAYFYLSNIYLEKKMYEEAESLMNVASHLKTTSSEIESVMASSGGNINENEIIKYRQSARFNYKEALKLLSEGEWHEAIKLLQAAASLEPGNEQYNVKIGEIFYDMKNNAKAMSYFKKSLLINPGNVTALKKLARMYYDERDYDNSCEYYTELYKITSDKKYLSLMHECSANKKTGSKMQEYVVLKRRGGNVFVNMGYNAGLAIGDQINKRLLVYRARKSSEIKDPRTTKVIGYERPVIVGELLVTRIENDMCEALVSSEQNGGITIGDEVRWKE